MPRASQASILNAAREMNNLEEREEVKKEKASVFKKDVSILIENLEYPKWEDMVRASIHNMNIKEKRLETG